MQAELSSEALQSQSEALDFLCFCKCIYVSASAKNTWVSVQLLINLLVSMIKQTDLPDLLSFRAV